VAAVRHGEVTVAGLRTPVIEAGPAGAAEAAVYVHGNPGSRLDWLDLVARTGEFARAIALDMPGFGDADKPHPRDYPYRARHLGLHLAGVLEQLGVRRAHFIGHDFGGPFAIAAALHKPALAGSLSFINTGLLRGYRWHKWARIWRTPVVGELYMLLTTEKRFRAGFRRLPAAFVEQMWRHFDWRTRRAVLALYRGSPTKDMSTATAALRALDLPSIVIWGVHDPYVGVEFAERNKEALPRATVHRIEQAGHWPFIDRPDEVAALLLPFLKSQLKSGTSTD
jgi:pimeloyl-ACP methyl ester carboxylesterase